MEPVSSLGVHEAPAVTGRENADKLSRLELEVAEMRKDIADLKQQFADQDSHLAMIGDVLQSLLCQQYEELRPGSNRDPDA